MSRRVYVEARGEQIRPYGKYAGVAGESDATEFAVWFDGAWDGYEKRVVWLNARNGNPVTVLLTGVDMVWTPEPDRQETLPIKYPYYRVLIPGEPLEHEGLCY